MIKTIIFDFGDIFINLDKPAIERELLALGIEEITPKMYDLAAQYEKGLISTENLTDFFTRGNWGISEKELHSAWNSIILDFPEYRLEFIENIHVQNRYNRSCYLYSCATFAAYQMG